VQVQRGSLEPFDEGVEVGGSGWELVACHSEVGAGPTEVGLGFGSAVHGGTHQGDPRFLEDWGHILGEESGGLLSVLLAGSDPGHSE
jgi:hypothetical protein